MEQAIHILAKVLTVLGLIGAVGCALVIPRTAFDLFSTFFQNDELEEDEQGPGPVEAGADETGRRATVTPVATQVPRAGDKGSDSRDEGYGE